MALSVIIRCDLCTRSIEYPEDGTLGQAGVLSEKLGSDGWLAVGCGSAKSYYCPACADDLGTAGEERLLSLGFWRGNEVLLRAIVIPKFEHRTRNLVDGLVEAIEHGVKLR